MFTRFMLDILYVLENIQVIVSWKDNELSDCHPE